MTRLTLSFFTSLLVLVGAFFSAPEEGEEAQMNTVELPIYVSGEGGSGDEIESMTLEISDVSSADRIYIRAHALGYEDYLIDYRGYSVSKASIRINGGPWVHPSGSWLGGSQNVSCFIPEDGHGSSLYNTSCVEGALHTIRFTMDDPDLISNLTDGTNTVEFRFNYPSWSNAGDVEVSSGYRILDFRVIDADDEDLVDGTTFTWDDPSTWTAPSGASASNGKTLWEARNSLSRGWGAGSTMEAACADCHARNGRDLQYFAYENEAIVERSKFHGLTESEGEDIAAYIRSIELRYKDGTLYDSPGRPWEPPYQPGPTALATRDVGEPRENGLPFEEINQAYWAAGAGLDWVFDLEVEMYPYLFPDSTISTDHFLVDEQATDAGKPERILNMRTLPLSLQMPDWNEWLPKVHPMDAYGDEFLVQATGGNPACDGADAWDWYNSEVLPVDETTGYKKTENTMNRFGGKVNNFRKCKKHNDVSGFYTGMAKTSIHQWGAVKEWEVLHTYGYEDMSGKRHANGEALGWGGHQRVIFNIAPHITGIDEPQPPKGDEGEVTDWYYDTAWYQHQMTINPGHNYHVGIKPVDWKYHFQHIRGYQGNSGYKQGIRLMASYMKLLQAAELAPDDVRGGTEPEGWYIKHTTPAWVVRHDGRNFFDGMGLAAENALCHANTVAIDFLIKGMTPEDPSKWSRQYGGAGIEPEDHTVKFENRLNQNDDYANQLYTAMQFLNQRGTPASVLEPLADWGEMMWPSSSWNDKLDQSASCGSLGTYEAPQLNQFDPTFEGGGDSGGFGETELLIGHFNLRPFSSTGGGQSSSPDWIEGRGPRARPDTADIGYAMHHTFDVSRDTMVAVYVDSLHAPEEDVHHSSNLWIGLRSDSTAQARGCAIELSPASQRAPHFSFSRKRCRASDGGQATFTGDEPVRGPWQVEIGYDSQATELNLRLIGTDTTLAWSETIDVGSDPFVTISTWGRPRVGQAEENASLRAHIDGIVFIRQEE